jgi:hypothetical protein
LNALGAKPICYHPTTTPRVSISFRGVMSHQSNYQIPGAAMELHAVHNLAFDAGEHIQESHFTAEVPQNQPKAMEARPIGQGGREFDSYDTVYQTPYARPDDLNLQPTPRQGETEAPISGISTDIPHIEVREPNKVEQRGGVLQAFLAVGVPSLLTLGACLVVLFMLINHKRDRYQLYTDPLSYPDAVAACEGRGGHLATVVSEAQLELLISISSGASNLVFLDVTLVAGRWTNRYGTDVTALLDQHWATGQPDGGSQDCLSVIYNKDSACSTWTCGLHDDRRTNLRYFLCETF